MSKWSPSNFGLGTIFRRTPIHEYPKVSLSIPDFSPGTSGGVGGGAGVITDPKFGTSHKRHSSRFIVPAGVAIQVYFNNPNTVRVSLRNVLNNPCVFDTNSNVFINPATGQAQYGSALQGAPGAEPTAGESDVFDNDNDIWAFSVGGTTIVVDEETKS